MLENKNFLFDHLTQKKTSFIPNVLCIGEQCINKDNVDMIDGKSTIKLKQKLDEKNIIVGGYDQVAVDSVVSKLMGFDPLKIKKLRMPIA